MAFRVPTQAPRRRTSYTTPQRPPLLEIPSSSAEQSADDTAQWVLFSPITHTPTISTDRTRTAGASGLSDFGSFDAATTSTTGPDSNLHAGDDLDEQLDEDGTELDSLDDGLHAFRAPSLPPTSPAQVDQGPSAMLPAHDGLGSFQESSQLVQEQLWHHEQYTPQRLPHVHSQHRGDTSAQRTLDTVDEREMNVERERWQRIEKWRMDQSRAVLQEIERETRQRRHSRASCAANSRSTDYTISQRQPGSSLESLSSPDAETEETFWRRITRKVIRDLIGIDDPMLSILFGESLPLESDSCAQNNEDMDVQSVLARDTEQEPEAADPPMWQGRILQQIARELGILVHQLCEHPGAFATYYQMTKDISGEYAGMPLDRLAESAKSQDPGESSALAYTDSTTDTSMPSPHFTPTIRDSNREYEAQWGIEEDNPGRDDAVSDSARLRHEQEYWEHGLDVMMVFRYLRTRFSRRGYMPSDKYTSTPTPRHTQDTSRRAAIIRQHHPLVARAHSRTQLQNRRASQYSGFSGTPGVSSPLMCPHSRRPSSSCASQSKLTAMSSRRTLTGSSRNYWDIGGSVDSNNAIGVGAGLGTWGEV